MPLALAIVGRPNVGKSTLFNRLAGKKLAIVDDQPGVTRDRRESAGRLGDLELRLIDTAGFDDVADASLEARMRAQTEIAIAQADVVLFLVDARVGVTPLDERFAALLRRSDKPVVLAANKAEGEAAEAGVLDAYGLGFGEPVAISGAHGEGMGDLYAALVGAMAANASPAEAQVDGELDPNGEDDAASGPARPIQIAIIGRPNAGKSTLINALIGEDRLLTGPEAGITRDAIAVDWTWRGRTFRMTDTAGMRKRAKVQERLEHASVGETLRAIKYAEVCVLVMDQADAFERQDLAIADLVFREGRALVFVLAKWDQAEEPGEQLKALREAAEEALPQTKGAPVVPVSALNGRGLDRLMEAVVRAHRNWDARVKTSDLNTWMRWAIERHPPPAVNGKRIKPRYITQIKARPPTFVLMCSRASALPDTYQRYLINGIREAFDLGGAPIRLIVRQNRNPYSPDDPKS